MPHIISNIQIENFKSIRDQEFEFESFTPLVGYNNAGKSNILQAIKWVLRKSSLGANYFYDTSIPITITAIIEGITEEILENIDQGHRARIEPFLNDGKIVIKRTQEIPNQSLGSIRLLVLDPLNGNNWQNNPAGIDNAIKDLFPEPIHIGAMENAEEDVTRSSSSSTIGKLLAEIIEPIEAQYGEQVIHALDGLKSLLDVEGANRAQELTLFDTQVNEKLEAFFPNLNVKIHIPTPELKEVFKKGTVKVFEDDFGAHKDVSSLGHGAQRSIQMALIRHLADLKLANQQTLTTTLLLIDEPELYLHPQAIEILRQSLKILSQQGYQVVFSTHSPFMITSKDVANTILVRKNALRGTHKRTSLKSAVPEIEEDAPHQLTLLYSLGNSSNILFSERIILAEGKTENKLLPIIIEKVTGRTLLNHKTALVEMTGSGNTRKAMRVLEVMDLPSKAIVDLDYALKQGVGDGYLTENDVDIQACKDHLQVISNQHNITIGVDDWPTKNQMMSAAEGFAILAQSVAVSQNIINIFEKMKTNGIWIWRKGTIEKHLNLNGKKEAVWAKFSADLENSNLATLFPNDHQEITECIQWLLE
jgi:putative ATP-dependent endonuclease of the OLD family